MVAKIRSGTNSANGMSIPFHLATHTAESYRLPFLHAILRHFHSLLKFLKVDELQNVPVRAREFRKPHESSVPRF